MKGIRSAWQGRAVWRRLRRKYSISYDKAVMALNSSDKEWNKYALLHLPDYIERKKAKEAIVLYTENTGNIEKEWMAEQNVNYARDEFPTKNNFHTEFVFLKEEDMRLLTHYYCFYRFFDSIAFCFKEGMTDNQSRMILDNGIVSKEELICLGFFHLRCIPDIRKEQRYV